MRETYIERQTKETAIALSLLIEGAGETSIDTGVPFFDHMLDAFGRHGLFNLTIKAKGDLAVDAHHTVEDVGIVLGQAFAQCLGDKKGVTRFGDALVPMDEALASAAVDISCRGQLHWDVALPIEFIGSFDTSLFKEFLIALAANAGLTLHVRSLVGANSHHIIEAVAKAVARAMSVAVALDPRIGDRIPSTKGSI